MISCVLLDVCVSAGVGVQRGSFVYGNAAEDSATAEISRSQAKSTSSFSPSLLWQQKTGSVPCPYLLRLIDLIPTGLLHDQDIGQIWQWVRHGLKTEEGVMMMEELVVGMANQTANELMAEGRDDKGIQVRRGEAGRGATGSGWAPFEFLEGVWCAW